MAQQTAVEWLEQSIAKKNLLVFMHIQELGFFEQAKQMEKEQIEKAIDEALNAYGIIKKDNIKV